MEEPVEVEDGRAVLNARQLGLRGANPAGDNLLRQSRASVVRVVPVGADYLAHVATGQGVSQRGVVPEAGRHVRSARDAVAFGDLTRGAASGGVVAGQTDPATTTLARANWSHTATSPDNGSD